MKVSLYTITLSGGYYGGPAVPLLDIFPKAKAWGYDGIELEGKRPHGSPLDLDGAARETIRRAAAGNGLELSWVAAYNDFSSPIDEHRESELLMVRELIRLAADLGARIVRVMAAWSGSTRRAGQALGADYRAFLEAAREIIGYRGHIGYELSSPVLIRHRHAGLDYALLQAELACQFMRQIIASLKERS